MIYADYNATTPLVGTSVEWLNQTLTEWGNPSSVHAKGRKALEMLERSRGIISEKVGCRPQDVVFTSGGSEANNLAIVGSFFFHKEFRLLTSPVEHSSVRDTRTLLERLGGKVSFVRVSPLGELDLDSLKAGLREFRPHLVSLMAANNETGVMFPIPAVVELCREFPVILHTDAV